MAMPFRNQDGIVAGVVYVGMRLDWLGEQLKLLPLPRDAAVSIADRNGIVLARYPDGARYVGISLSADGLATLHRSEMAVAELTGVDGVKRTSAYAPLGVLSGGLRVAVALDKRTFFDAVSQPSRTGLILIVAGFGLALTITGLLGGRAISRPVAGLLQITNRWRNGDLTARTGLYKDGSEFGRLAIAFDAMAEAQEARDRSLRMALESTTDGVIVLSRSWRFTYLNKRAEAKIAHGRDLVGLEVWNECPWLEDSAVGRGLRQAMQSGAPAHMDDYFAPADVHFDAHAYPSKDGLTVFFHDVTEERRISAALAKTESQLEAARARAVHAERLEALGQLAGGIAHDFNNVLQVVNGVATLIQRRPGDADSVSRLARLAMDATERGGSITQRLLAFGRRGDLHAEALDMADLLDGLREIFVHTLGAGIDVHIELEDGLPPAFADRAQLETVVVNLATNARDAMPQGGRLTIAAAIEDVAPGDSVHPADLTPRRYVRLTVADTGIGMDAHTLARAQEPFFTTKKAGLGTGLGLPMATGFAEQSGGALSIESSPGQGTAVTLWLPADDPARHAAETAPDHAVESAPSGTGMALTGARVLLVEDENLLREVLRQNLEDRGYDVVMAASGAEALALLTEGEQVDVLVTDLAMPGMDGIAAIRGAREHRPGLPAVLLTGYAGEEAALMAGRPITGAYSLARKPIATDDLVERIEALLLARSSVVAGSAA
jgi:signal transduction histidine kinase/ActR/RegA family two-component response regulator